MPQRGGGPTIKAGPTAYSSRPRSPNRQPWLRGLPSEPVSCRAWLWKHIADLGELTFRLLLPGQEFRAKLLASWVSERAGVDTKQLFGIRVANCDDLAVAEGIAKYIKVPVVPAPDIETPSLILSGDCRG